MNMQDNDQWLDELISRTINTDKLQFDVEKWKQKFPSEFQILQSRATKMPAHSSKWLATLRSPVIKFAAAAILIVTIGLSVVLFSRWQKAESIDVTEFTQSPADMESILSLNIAYRRGGIEAVERQSEEAIKMLGQRPAQITIQQILSELNGT